MDRVAACVPAGLVEHVTVPRIVYVDILATSLVIVCVNSSESDPEARQCRPRRSPSRDTASRPPRLARLGFRRPVHGGLRHRVPRAAGLRAVPQPLPRPARRRHRVRRLRELRARARPTRSSGRPSAASFVFLLVQVPIMLDARPRARRSRSTARDCAAPRSSGITLFLPYAVPAVVAVLMWGFIYGDQFGLTADINELSRLRAHHAVRAGVDAGLDRQHRHVGVRRLQHAHLLLGAEDDPQRAVRGRGARRRRRRGARSSRSRSRRCAGRSSSRRSSRSSAASSSSTSRTSCARSRRT